MTFRTFRGEGKREPMSLSALPKYAPELSVIIPAKNAEAFLESTVHTLDLFLKTQVKRTYEIVIVPNGFTESSMRENKTFLLAEKIASVNLNVKNFPHFTPLGKGAAVRTGFSKAQGERVAFLDADLQYGLDFLKEALLISNDRYDLITSNRRLPESWLEIPVAVMPWVYFRHRIGMFFNFFVRALFRLKTTDTQAGSKVVSRKLKDLALAKMKCPGFYFDIELFLIARAHGLSTMEAPVAVYVRDEASTVRVFNLLFPTLYWLLKIRVKDLIGAYR